MGQVIELVSSHAWSQSSGTAMVDTSNSCEVHGAALMQKEAGADRSELCWSHFHDAIVKGEVTRCRDMLTSTTCCTDACLGALTPQQRLRHLDSIAFCKLRTTSLHMAALYRRADLVKLLLEQGSEPTVMDGFGRVPAAVLLEHWPRVTFPPDPRHRQFDPTSQHPAAAAALHQGRAHNSDTVLQLWAGRADLSADASGCGGDREMALFRRQVAAWRASSALCLKLLLDHGLQLNDVADRRRASTLLHIAARYDLVDVIDLVIDMGARKASPSPSSSARRGSGLASSAGGRRCGNCNAIAGIVDNSDGETAGRRRKNGQQQRESTKTKAGEKPVSGHSPGVLSLPGRVKRAVIRRVRSAAGRSQELCMSSWASNPCRKNRLFARTQRSASHINDAQLCPGTSGRQKRGKALAASMDRGEPSAASTELGQAKPEEESDDEGGEGVDNDEENVEGHSEGKIVVEKTNSGAECRQNFKARPNEGERGEGCGQSVEQDTGVAGSIRKGRKRERPIKSGEASTERRGTEQVVADAGGTESKGSGSGRGTVGTAGKGNSTRGVLQIHEDSEDHSRAGAAKSPGGRKASSARSSRCAGRPDMEMENQKCVDLEVRNATAKTPLAVALDRGSLHAAHCLLAHGADIFAVDFYGRSVLHFLSERDSSFDLFLRDVVRQGVDVHATDNGGNTPLHVAAYMGNASKVRYLLSAGATPDRANLAGKTPLFLSFHRRDTSAKEIILLFLLASATLRMRDKLDRSPVLMQRDQNALVQMELDYLQRTCSSLLRHCVVAIRRALGLSRLLAMTEMSPLPCPGFLQRVIYGEDERRIVELLCI